jgi:hypothetical protein
VPWNVPARFLAQISTLQYRVGARFKARVPCLPVFQCGTRLFPPRYISWLGIRDPGNLIHGMRVVDSSNGMVLFQGCGRNLDTWIKLAPGTYNFTAESLYGCADPPPGSAEGVQLGPVTIN